MGSRTTPDRNIKDSVIIREPIVPNIGHSQSNQDQVADVCEISFDVKLEESPLAKIGVPINIKKSGTHYHILVLASSIGKLSTRQSKMIETCALLGVNYVGKIIKKSNGMYARFTRIV
ncbi:hypothetical protein [Chitinophaga sp. OAE865]|uniref:hypothetical protein n=1 Tax=Chitinophaga sp. OAE865 TaxID=2817898 RepID=UPI001AEBA537